MRIQSKYRKYINVIFILGPMTMIMAFVGVARNYGLHEGSLLKIIKTWLTMFPIAFTCGLIIIPAANKLTSKINFTEKDCIHEERTDEVLHGIKNGN
ncbi:MAG TPA: DUF2798 domain-containing protein [Puia sp.]|nr:DUF2798 domain-containing protein [Puia sp.]